MSTSLRFGGEWIVMLEQVSWHERNVEIKARLTDLESTQARLRDLGAEECGVLVQCDTFFRCNAGRLKLRIQ